ncbi:hypothetical protein Acid345_4411 [Candidatus Koribacter versatilis Ellin345]|uniref:Uncharacterized protein n=1 Tax=Koribacter versatilis (strain Ellin345) TaxID=204669 RepID=Q1II89_KORVE|nr:hypothetical protein [Candidatus Koribacter versatilis]ABF43411.1 hypothetical protein Acid345_4411 [Candidatus Koribacter versatilis Ellin345]
MAHSPRHSLLSLEMGTAQAATDVQVAPGTRRAAWYCVALALVPVVAVVASLVIARSQRFVQHQRNSYLAISDYPFTLTNVNCDVVVFGDSSALTGVAPQVIEAKTGLKTCNIAQPNTTLAVAGTFALDSYLQSNKAPKFLVIQFLAPHFSASFENGLSTEGALQLVRHRLDFTTVKLFARHPVDALAFSEFVLRSAMFDRDRSGETSRRAWAQIEANRGMLTVPGPPLQSCIGENEQRNPDAAYISALRARYAKSGAHVIINAAPYPACDAGYDFYAKALAGVSDNSLPKFDIQLFNEKAHYTREGAERNSALIAGQIQNWK